MGNSSVIRLGLKRFALTLFVSFILVFVSSEVAFFFLKENTDRAPQQIELVIPSGTAAKVVAGEPVPSIPDEMVFVIGDTLVVKNEDSTDHQLGPLWIPPQSKASLVLDTANRYIYSCSFQPSQYFGLNVKQPTTWGTRLTALGFAVPATTVFIFMYSLVLWPIKPAQDKSQATRFEKAGEAPGHEH